MLHHDAVNIAGEICRFVTYALLSMLYFYQLACQHSHARLSASMSTMTIVAKSSHNIGMATASTCEPRIGHSQAARTLQLIALHPRVTRKTAIPKKVAL
jgi:hypothetical protein